jgi:hypothetical protein
MPLDKSKSKQAFSRNVATEMNAGKGQKQALAIAYSVSRKAKTGGMIPSPSIGGVLSKKPWKGYKRGGMTYADGGETTDYDLPDVGPAPIGDGGKFSEGSPWANKAADIGSKIAGNSVIGAATLPYRYVKGTVDAAREEPFSEGSEAALRNVGALTGEMGMQMAGRGKPDGNTSGVFVGPYGAHMLRDADRGAMKPHPVIGQEVAERASSLRPEFQDIYKGAAQDMRDAEARGTLEMRQGSLSGPQTDRDVFPRSGWSYGAEGMPRKEIPDVGAKLVEVGRNQYKLEHPAGNLHELYDVPPITFDSGLKKGNAEFHPETNQIVLGGSPTKENLKSSVSAALHEFQHAIQQKEGFAAGSNPNIAAIKGPLETELFPGEHPSWWQGKSYSGGYGPDRVTAALNPQGGAAFNTYERAAGETEARNVQNRRAKSYRYQAHPEDTEDVTRGIQWVDPRHMPRQYEKRGGAVKKAIGGSTSVPWFERQEARGMTSGLLHSTLPGRTDKLPLNVAGGSYVLPADIPSAIGQGNTTAGAAILKRMFTTGPFGMALKGGGSGKSARPPQMHMAHYGQHFASGGDTNGVSKIIAAGGEYILTPDQVKQLGGGDLDRGHKILDAFVKHIRKQHINTLKKLPGPKKD